jgi:pimeloyl-ACP methyl ester carboxylesterase
VIVEASPPDLEWLDRGGRRFACRHRRGRGPTLVFLPGYASDMEGSKASALDSWAAERGQAILRFDYSGCGASPGDFEAQTLAGWRDDTLAAVDSTEGPVVLIGSSMGGWLMLLAALARPQRVAALIGISAAPDFTDWGYSEAEKRAIRETGRLSQPSPYSPTVTTRAFWESGEGLKLLGGPIPFAGPVRLLHGSADADVPWRVSLELMERLATPDARLTLVKGGDHRLSRESDIALLLSTVEEVAVQAACSQSR